MLDMTLQVGTFLFQQSLFTDILLAGILIAFVLEMVSWIKEGANN